MAEDKKPTGPNFEKGVAVQLEKQVALRTRELESLVDNIPGLVAIMAADGAVEFVNERDREYFGRTLEQLKEWTISDAVHPHDLPYAVETWRRSIEAGQPYDFDHRLLRHDGIYRWFHASGLPIRDSDGRIVRWYVLLTDIHERKTAEQQLRQYAIEQASVVDTIPGLVMTATAEGEVEFVNKGALQYFGRTLEELKRWTVSDSVHPDDLIYVLDAWRRCVETGQRHDLDHRCRRADGEYRWFHASALPLHDADGRIVRWYVLLTDIHERKTAEEKLRRDEAELRRVTDAIPDFIHILRPDGTILHANQTALDYSGLNLDDAQNADYRSRLFHPEDAERLGEEWRAALGRAVPFERELRALRKDGKYRWYLVRYNPLEDEHGRIIRWYATGTDIEERKQAELRLQAENAYLLDEIRSERNFGDIIGASSGLRKVMHHIKVVAPTDATVLITGESGTGKELVARRIHEQSARRERPLVKLNCSAVPEGLFESEFFGHVKGAFTGALKDKPGRFELADGGTLFLDEIGEVPLAMQSKLLRVLQEQELERVGDTHTRKVNVRVVAATNRDLKKEVDQGRFRQDLFYRLSVFPIEMPPLRQRREDIAPLVAHFVRQSARRMNRPEPQISKVALEQLSTYQWPGNVRELQNMIERAVILWRDGPLTFDLPDSLPLRTNGAAATPGANAAVLTRDELKRGERDAIIKALKQTNGKVSGPGGAAELLGMKPTTLSSRISSLGIDRRTLS